MMNIQNEEENGEKLNLSQDNYSSAKDLALFLEEESKIQKEILSKDALKIEELEDLLHQNQKKMDGVDEPVDNRMKLNLLNVINNDRIENQVISENIKEDDDIATEENYNAKH